VRLRVALALATALVVIGAGPAAALGDVVKHDRSSEGSALRGSLRAELSRYLSTRGVAEHVSAVSLAAAFRGQRSSINLAVGNTRYGGGRPISLHSLWEIGSNTSVDFPGFVDT
jgi:D-alanyl-D-alanine carboxypeptidase